MKVTLQRTFNKIIISSNTEKHLTVNQFTLNKLDPVAVKGKKETIEIFQVMIESEKKVSN